MAEEFLGSWTSIAATNEDKLMEAMGVPEQTRAVLKNGSHTVTISQDGDHYLMKTVTEMKMENGVKTHEIKFKMGEPFEEKMPDGRVFTSKISVSGGKWVQEKTPKPDGKKQEFHLCRKGDELHGEITYDGVTGTRTLKKI